MTKALMALLESAQPENSRLPWVGMRLIRAADEKATAEPATDGWSLPPRLHLVQIAGVLFEPLR